MAKFVLEEEIFFQNKKVFGDKMEHPFNCKCYNGYAECVAIDCEDNENIPHKVIRLTYPLRKDIVSSNDKSEMVLRYRGLYDLSKKDITYGDIMMCFGVIEIPKKKCCS